MLNIRDQKRLQLRNEIQNAIRNLYLEGYTWLEIMKKLDFKSTRSIHLYTKEFTPEDRRNHLIALYTRKLEKFKIEK